MDSCKIKKCNCEHDFQDKTYGKFKRLFTLTRKAKGIDVLYRCTVCKTEKV